MSLKDMKIYSRKQIMKKLRVLSTFDGCSTGRLALERAGIEIEKYYASEIEPKAIAVSQKNWTDVEQVGDITQLTGEGLGEIDLLIGGSSCVDFSFGGSRRGMVTTENQEITSLEQYLELKEAGVEFKGQSFLFWEYIRLLRELKPKYFLLENVKMAKKWQDIISFEMDIDPIEINSVLVSAQKRKRLYWTNIPNITQPQDKGIYLEDILQEEVDEKYFLAPTRLDYNNYDKKKVDRSIHQYTATSIGNSKNFGNNISNSGKAYTLRRIEPNGVICPDDRIRKFTPIEAERLQTMPDDYTLIEGIKDRERYAILGNGWTADVIVHIFEAMKKDLEA